MMVYHYYWFFLLVGVIVYQMDLLNFYLQILIMPFVYTSISAGTSRVVGNMKRTPNRNLSRTTITIITIITNAM
jgi:hypothetical protein